MVGHEGEQEPPAPGCAEARDSLTEIVRREFVLLKINAAKAIDLHIHEAGPHPSVSRQGGGCWLDSGNQAFAPLDADGLTARAKPGADLSAVHGSIVPFVPGGLARRFN